MTKARIATDTQARKACCFAGHPKSGPMFSLKTTGMLSRDQTGRRKGQSCAEMLSLKLQTTNPMNTTETTIREDHTLKSATMRGHPLMIYDDGVGPLWVYSESLGPRGIIRAQSWEAAYGIAEDEFMDEASETVEELQKEYGFRREHRKVLDASGEFACWETVETPDPDAWVDNELFQEAYGFRPNGPRAGKWPNGEPRDPIGHGIYIKDLNGSTLHKLTPELAGEWGIEITTEPN